MKQALLRLRDEMGTVGVVSILVLFAAFAFNAFHVEPLKNQATELRAQLARQARSGDGQPSSASDKLAAFYRFIEKPEQTTDWLAKLYSVGQATGVNLQSASYKTQAAGGRLERYEIVLPVSGSYAQIRQFLRRSLTEIPVLSLDQVAIKRETRTDGSVQAELRLSLHQIRDHEKGKP